MVTASNTMMTPTINIATHTPPIMYRLSFGASEKENKVNSVVDKEQFNNLKVKSFVCFPEFL